MSLDNGGLPVIKFGAVTYMRLPFSSNGKLKMLMIGKLVLFVNFITTLLGLFLCLWVLVSNSIAWNSLTGGKVY